jgi:hypothetical protein
MTSQILSSGPSVVTRKTRILSNISEFLTTQAYIDLKLISGDKVYLAHRVHLASVCSWFATELAKPENALSPASSDVLELTLPENRDNSFGLFLDVIYTGRAQITVDNIAPLLHTALFYGAPSYVEMFRFFLDTFSQERDLLNIFQRLDRLGLSTEALRFVPKLARGLTDLLASPGKAAFTLEDLYNSISPIVFAAILKSPEFVVAVPDRDDLLARLTDDYYDAFVKSGRTLSDSDRVALGSTIDWGNEDNLAIIRPLFARHKCEWLPADTSLTLLNAVLKARTITLRNARRATSSIKGTTSRWFIAGWLHTVRTAVVLRQPRFKLLNFISTLGQVVPPIDPAKYGFVNVSSRGQILGPLYGPCQIFQPGRYFLGFASTTDVPSVEIDFLNARVEAEKITWNTDIKPPVRKTPSYKCPPPAPKPTKYKVAVKWGIGKLASLLESSDSALENIQATATVVSIGFPEVGVISPAVIPKDERGPFPPLNPVARLESIELEGSFVA